jgi:hypothetical protein
MKIYKAKTGRIVRKIIDKAIILVGDLNIRLSVIDRQKMSKGIIALNNTTNQVVLFYIYR